MSDATDRGPVWVTPVDLFDQLWPLSGQTTIALTAGAGLSRLRDAADVQKAITAWKNGSLAEGEFDLSGEGKRTYRKTGMTHLGLSPVKAEMLGWFAVELSPAPGDDAGTRYLEPMGSLFGAEPVVFKSRGGAGYQMFFTLAEPVPFAEFRSWAASPSSSVRGRLCPYRPILGLLGQKSRLGSASASTGERTQRGRPRRFGISTPSRSMIAA